MLDQIEELFKKRNTFFHKNQGITVVSSEAQPQGLKLAKEILYEVVDKKTVLYLSGGSLKTLYENLAKEERLLPGAVGQVDERYGPIFHSTSNQLMIRDAGLTRYLEIRDIPFYAMLQNKPREETARMYDEKFRDLNAVFPKSVAIMGIGADGHTAGLPAQNSKFPISNFQLDNHSLVTEYNDAKGNYEERVTMTFLGLEMLDLMIILVFGQDKQKALEKMFEEGSEMEIPAGFFKRPEIAKKTLLITDQRV